MMSDHEKFQDRADAGRRLADALGEYADRDDVVVLGLSRSGVPVAYEVARRLNAPLDVFIVRKLGVPGQEELAMGAIASGGVRVLNETVISELTITEDTIARVAAEEQEELERLERTYREDRPDRDLADRTILLVDDGLATGTTMRAAAGAVGSHGPRQVVVAVPVAAAETCEDLRGTVDRVVCPMTPDPFGSVGAWYERFPQTRTEDVVSLLRRAETSVPERG